MALFDDIDMEMLRAWKGSAPGFVRRQAKHARQVRFGWRHPQQLGFVFGCQRSGTKMVMRVLDRSEATRIYHENHAAAFEDFQLRSDRTVRALVQLSPAPAQVFKPICDSHEADHILERFPEAHGVWVFRHPDDVANSAVKKWGAHQRILIDAVVAGDLDTWGWRTARVLPAIREALVRVHRPDLSDHEGALLFWYMRNAFFFELGLDRHPRMKLVNYRTLVEHPERGFRELFDHLGAPFDMTYVDRVHTGSLRKTEPPPASPEIRALCAELQARLEAWTPPAVPEPRPSPLLVLIDTLGTGGAERYVVTIANWMVEHGIDAIVAAHPGDLTRDLDPRVRWTPVPLKRVRGAEIPAAVGSIRGLIEEHHPQAIIANSLALTILARAARLGRHIPVVNVAHGWPADRYTQVGPLMRTADAVVAVSPDVRHKLVAGGADPARVWVVFNGVDCRDLGPRTGETRDRARRELGAEPGDLLVVCVGRLEAQKAHQHVVTIAQKLGASHPGVRFAVVGGGTRAEELALLVAQAGVGDRVCLAGKRADVPDLLGSADLFLNCSDWEGMPLTTIEAMASGLPVVATRTEGADQLLDETCGRVVPVGDVDALAAEIAALADDADTRAALGAAARERALAHFSHDRMTRELLKVVGRLVG